MRKKFSAYLMMSHDQIWLATRAVVPQVMGMRQVVGKDHTSYQITPVHGPLPAEGVDGMSVKEFQDYLKYGHVYTGPIAVNVDDAGDISLIGGYGMRAIIGANPDHAPTEHEVDLFQAVEEIAGWVQRAATPAPKPPAAALAAALKQLEAANQALAAERGQDIYDAMIDAGLGDLMAELDAARREARDALSGAGPVRLNVTIEDHQHPDFRSEGMPDTIGVRIEPHVCTLQITTEDGRKIDLELENGVLRALAYENDDGKEAPITISIPPEGDITVETRDYALEDRCGDLSPN